MERRKFIVVEPAGYVDTIVNNMCLKSFIFTYKMRRMYTTTKFTVHQAEGI